MPVEEYKENLRKIVHHIKVIFFILSLKVSLRCFLFLIFVYISSLTYFAVIADYGVQPT